MTATQPQKVANTQKIILDKQNIIRNFVTIMRLALHGVDWF